MQINFKKAIYEINGKEYEVIQPNEERSKEILAIIKEEQPDFKLDMKDSPLLFISHDPSDEEKGESMLSFLRGYFYDLLQKGPVAIIKCKH